MIGAAYMVEVGRCEFEPDEMRRLKAIVTFAARYLKRLFKEWILQNRDNAEVFSTIGMTVAEMLVMQNEGEATFEELMQDYHRTAIYGGELELQILTYLAPGLKIQIEQGGAPDAVQGEDSADTRHTLFLKRERIADHDNCHYNLNLWDLAE